MPMNLTTSTGVVIPIEDNLAGQHKWDAFYAYREAYEKLTTAAHRLSSDDGGPDDRERQDAAPHVTVAPDKSVGLRWFLGQTEGAIRDLEAACKRIELFAGGEVYDELIDPTLLGPRVDRTTHTKSRTIVVNDGTYEQGPTFIEGRWTGVRLYLSQNDDGQVCVGIMTEDAAERFTVGGYPKMFVSLNDATLYDQEEEDGERTLRVDDERDIRLIEKALRGAEAAIFTDEENAARDRLLDRIERDIKLPEGG